MLWFNGLMGVDVVDAVCTFRRACVICMFSRQRSGVHGWLYIGQRWRRVGQRRRILHHAPPELFLRLLQSMCDQSMTRKHELALLM